MSPNPFEAGQANAQELIPADLEQATADIGPIGGRVAPERMTEFRALAKDPHKAEKIFDYLMGRSFKADRGGWVIQSMAWALDLDIPRAIVEAGLKRRKPEENPE